MVEENNILDQLNFQIRRKGYDIDEVNAFIKNLHKGYTDETLRANNLSEIISNMEKVLKDNLEEEYDENKSMIDIMLDIVLLNKKQRYQLESKQKRIDELEEKLKSFDNVQNKVMEILASAQEFRKQAEQQAGLILEKAQQEADMLVDNVRKEADDRCAEFNQRSRDILDQTHKEVINTSDKMKEVLELYFNEIKSISDGVEQLRAEHRNVLQLELERLQEAWKPNWVDNRMEELKSSIHHLEALIDETLDNIEEKPEESCLAQ